MEFLVVICQDVKTHLVTIPDISFVGRYVMRKPESIILWTHGQKPHFSIIAMRFFSFTDAQEAHLVTWRHFYQIYGHISICCGLDSAANTRFVVKPWHQKPQPGAAQCWAAAMTHVCGLISGAILTPGDPPSSHQPPSRPNSVTSTDWGQAIIRQTIYSAVAYLTNFVPCSALPFGFTHNFC